MGIEGSTMLLVETRAPLKEVTRVAQEAATEIKVKDPSVSFKVENVSKGVIKVHVAAGPGFEHMEKRIDGYTQVIAEKLDSGKSRVVRGMTDLSAVLN